MGWWNLFKYLKSDEGFFYVKLILKLDLEKWDEQWVVYFMAT